MTEYEPYVCVECEDGWHSKCTCPDICECPVCLSEGREHL